MTAREITPGVESYTPDDGAERLRAALGGRVLERARGAEPPPFTQAVPQLDPILGGMAAALKGARDGQ